MSSIQEAQEILNLLNESEKISNPEVKERFQSYVLTLLPPPPPESQMKDVLSEDIIVHVPPRVLRDVPSARKPTPPVPPINPDSDGQRVLKALQNFPEGISSSELSEVVESDLKLKVSRCLWGLHDRGVIDRTRGPSAGVDTEGKSHPMYIYFPQPRRERSK